MIALKKEMKDINEKSEEKEDKTWIDINIEAEDLENYDGRQYELELPDGTKRTGTVKKNAVFNIRADGIEKGSGKATFRILDE